MDAWPSRPPEVDLWEFHDLLDAVYETAELLRTDVVFGDSRAVGEIASRFDLLMAEIVRRIDADDWHPRAA